MDDQASPGNGALESAEFLEPSRRQLLVRRAIETWKRQLIDLGGRNNLLYYRDLKAGTLDLSAVPAGALEALVRGTSVSFSKLFPDEETHAEAIRRGRTLYRKGRELFEERGIETLFLAWGMATWTSPTVASTPAAPVLLRPATLVPRSPALDQFDLVLMGEMEVSPTFLHLLATDFRCRPDLTKLELDGAIDTIGELDHVLDWLRSEGVVVPGFDVSRRVVLGTFSYMKLPMVRDLEESTDLLEEHDLVAAIAGDEGARQLVRDRYAAVQVSLEDPNHTPPADEFLILDADSSQNYAINSVVAGSDMIVRGPPGTGKSQTIANLVATLVARGKKVLFVAEKRAAIDAVLKRVESVGLDDVVFDLHGGVSGRRQLLESLMRGLRAVHAVPLVNRDAAFQELERRRRDLLERAEALHSSRVPWNVSVYELQCELLGLPAASQTEVMFRGEVLDGLDGQTLQDALESLGEFAGLGGLTLWAGDSPWKDARVTSPDAARVALETADRLRTHTLPVTRRVIDTAARETSTTVPSQLQEWVQLTELWEEVSETLRTASPAIYAQPLREWSFALAPASGRFVSRFAATMTSGDYRRAKSGISAVLNANAKGVNLHRLASSALDQLERFASFAPTGVAPSAPADLAGVVNSYQQLGRELDELVGFLGPDAVAERSAEGLVTLLERLVADRVTLTRLPDLYRLERDLRAHGLGELLEELRSRQLAQRLCRSSLRYAWLRSIFERVCLEDPLIGAFDGQHHSQTVDDYRRLDRDHVETNAMRVQRLWAERVVGKRDEKPDEASLIEMQARLKRRTKNWRGFREIVDEAQSLLLELKPCWVMSPLVVSQVLPPERLFDVVVFDEASQIRPADAVPAIARGSQVVVAGDERQLPPTSFFFSASPEEEADEEEMEDAPKLAATEGFESILDSLAMLLPFRQLEWHYRSEDERLIAFSNAHFYDQSLTTFPGVGGDAPLSHVLVPFQPGQQGQEQSATREVQEVVRLILEQAEARPDESLGVIAMGIKHANRIEDALLDALQERDDLAEFFSDTVEERFFVKNLERVQGDERDGIILSIGYGKNDDGRLLYRFGPLNLEGGERRLNVAVTRARKRLTLVSAFASADMDPNRTSSEGARLLRHYIQYAESHGANLGERALQKPALNPFEIDVRDTLVRAGIPLVAQHGCSGYLIDFVAQHREQRGRFVLAVECDGASYHSSPTARDRDRLRQQQLERLGWRFQRIWSTDWFTNKEACVDRVLAAYERALLGKPNTTNFVRQQSPTEETVVSLSEQLLSPTDARGPRPDVPPGYVIDDYTNEEIESLIVWIGSDNLLRTEDQLLEEAMRELGFARRGKTIVARLLRAIRAARS